MLQLACFHSSWSQPRRLGTKGGKTPEYGPLKNPIMSKSGHSGPEFLVLCWTFGSHLEATKAIPHPPRKRPNLDFPKPNECQDVWVETTLRDMCCCCWQHVVMLLASIASFLHPPPIYPVTWENTPSKGFSGPFISIYRTRWISYNLYLYFFNWSN